MNITFESDDDANALRGFLTESAGGTGKYADVENLVGLRAQAEANLKRLEAPVRMMLAGEFSSGKSSIANLLIGEQLIPTGVLASPLPPVVFRHGPETTSAACWWAGREPENFKGAQFQAIMALDPDYIVLAAPNPLLKHVTIFDTPGSSDPDRDGEILVELSGRAEMVIWCTNAVQAWRESERETWFKLSNTVIRNGLLAVTHVDLPSVRNGFARIMGRLDREAGPHFKGILPIETLTALEAAPGGVVKDAKAWTASGAEALVRAILDLAASVRMPDIVGAREFMVRYLAPYIDIPAPKVVPPPVEAPATPDPVQRKPAPAAKPVVADVAEKPVASQAPGQKVNPLAGFAKLRGAGSRVAAEVPSAAYVGEAVVADPPQPETQPDTQPGAKRKAEPAAMPKPLVSGPKARPKPTRQNPALVQEWLAKIDALIPHVRDHSDLESSGFVQLIGDVVMEMIEAINTGDLARGEAKWLEHEFQDALDLMIMMQMETGETAMEEAATLLLQLSRDLALLVQKNG
jgi:Dynamin family